MWEAHVWRELGWRSVQNSHFLSLYNLYIFNANFIWSFDNITIVYLFFRDEWWYALDVVWRILMLQYVCLLRYSVSKLFCKCKLFLSLIQITWIKKIIFPKHYLAVQNDIKNKTCDRISLWNYDNTLNYMLYVYFKKRMTTI